jgi:phage-related protein
MGKKPCIFIASCKDDLTRLPQPAKDVIGFALHLAQIGEKHPDAKPLTGHREFSGAAVMEVVDDFDGDTYRGVYTVKFAGAVYALDVFQKKSKSGIATSQADINRIKGRLQRAKEHYEKNFRRPRKKK